MSRRLGLCLSVAGLALSACGTSAGGTSASARALHAAVSITERQGTAHFASMNRIRSRPGNQGTITVSTVGDVRFQGPAATYTTTVTSPGHPVTPVPGVVLGRDLYLGLGGANEPMWHHTHLTSDYAVFGIATVHQLLAADASVTEVGRTTLGDDPATEFIVHDPGGPIGQAYITPAATVEPFELQVWVSRQGCIVQVAAVQMVVRNSPHFEATSSTTVTLSGFGEPVTIVAPSPTATG